MSCSKPLRKVNVFGYGMREEQHYYRGKLSDDGNYLKASFEAFLGAPGKHSIEPKKVPLKFEDYCVSRFPGRILIQLNGLSNMNKKRELKIFSVGNLFSIKIGWMEVKQKYESEKYSVGT